MGCLVILIVGIRKFINIIDKFDIETLYPPSVTMAGIEGHLPLQGMLHKCIKPCKCTASSEVMKVSFSWQTFMNSYFSNYLIIGFVYYSNIHFR